jgi:hypothetical protein
MKRKEKGKRKEKVSFFKGDCGGGWGHLFEN